MAVLINARNSYVCAQKDRFSPNRPPLVKPGRCPVSNEITPCDCNLANIRCNGDQDCPGVQKCCSFGCGCRTRCEVPEGGKKEVCRYNGRFYKVGQSFPAGDGCNRCTCRSNGQVICTLIACATKCTYNYRTYRPGQSFPSTDGCNRCTCGSDGRVSCTERACIRRCRYNGRYYRVGQRFPSIDGCNRCSCGSNGRVFCTKRACVKSPSKGVCYQSKVVGPCRGAFRRWWYNKLTNRCELFSYGGCRGNQNNFKTKFDCVRRCTRRSCK
ncbi:kielin/chordin-like protein [Saccostrea echinata]|uniref:kielin/chordin-like protein n=1 Tax=Saccostrea echinata TaxID=191078 RepID=UPI002A8040DC|nr:kielin/chordin-like protein [Saccostrea echinata]